MGERTETGYHFHARDKGSAVDLVHDDHWHCTMTNPGKPVVVFDPNDQNLKTHLSEVLHDHLWEGFPKDEADCCVDALLDALVEHSKGDDGERTDS
jgi:hypothetical protein